MVGDISRTGTDNQSIPFPNPEEGKHTFVDLFAGIGGIRLPFYELGYKCLFSSEWDESAKKRTKLILGKKLCFPSIWHENTYRRVSCSFVIYWT